MGPHVSSQEDTQAVLDGVRRIVHSLRESSSWAERHVGLSSAQLFVLRALTDSAGLSVNELASRTHTHQSSVSVVVSRLVAKKLVTRARSAADRRSVVLSLSAEGRRLASFAPDAPQERLIQGVRRMSAARRRLLASALGELAQAVDAADRAPAMFFEDRSRRRKGRHTRA